MNSIEGTIHLTFNSDQSKERVGRILEDRKQAFEDKIAESEDLRDDIGHVSIRVPKMAHLEICP